MGQILVWHADERKVFNRQKGKEVKEKEIVIEDGYQCIENEAFKNNIRIQKVVLGDSVKEVGVRSFHNCTNLKKVELLCVENIQKEAFSGCTNLKEVRLPGQLKQIGKSAFADCRRMSLVEFGGNVWQGNRISELPTRVFYKCVSLEEFVFPLNLRCIGREAFYQTNLKELDLPNMLVRIEDRAFFKCNQLEYVRIPESVRKMGNGAFRGCNRLKVLEIPRDLEEIGECIINRGTKLRCQPGSKIDAYGKANGLEIEYI